MRHTDPSGHIICLDGEQCYNGGGGGSIFLGGGSSGGGNHGGDEEDEGEFIFEEIGQFYVGPNIPKDLNEYEASAYGGHGLANMPSVAWAAFGDGSGFLWDMTDMYSRIRNNSNVSVFANLKQYHNGTVGIAGLTIVNASQETIFINYVNLTSKGNPLLEAITGTCNTLDQCYYPNPPRIVPAGNDSSYLASIDPKSVEIVSLTPSGYPANPNNHFGPQGIQSVEISVYFRFTSELRYLRINETIIP